MSSQIPTEEEREDLLLSCRYGELDEVKDFVERFGSASLSDVADENKNTVLHMTCANGHLDLLQYLLTAVPSRLISSQNASGSTPLHWVAVGQHLLVAKELIQFSGGPGVDLIDIKNSAGRTPLGEAELGGWDEGAKWFVEVMKLEDTTVEEGDTKDEDDADADDTFEGGDIQVEIQDANGGIARMSLSSNVIGKTEVP